MTERHSVECGGGTCTTDSSRKKEVVSTRDSSFEGEWETKKSENNRDLLEKILETWNFRITTGVTEVHPRNAVTDVTLKGINKVG